MTWVCGVFSSEIAAAWFAGGATILAAIAAVCIFIKGRRHAESDRESQRRVLYTRMRARLHHAPYQLMVRLAQFDALPAEVGLPQWRSTFSAMRLQHIDQLRDHQAALTGLGGVGDGVIAGFVENALIFNETMTDLAQMVVDNMNAPGQLVFDRALLREEIVLVLDRSKSANAALETALGGK